MQDAERGFLFDLLRTPSPSGFEMAGQRAWAKYVGQHADRVETDAYGTTWATRDAAQPDAAPTVMLEAHADEIGFMVNFVSDEGFIHVTRIGGSDRAIARGKRVRVLGAKGSVNGVVGNLAIHLREAKSDRIPEWHKIYIDVGATNREGVEEMGIRVGNPIVYDDEPLELSSSRLIGRALDNRIGGFILAQVMAKLAAKDRIASTVYAVNAVQEEIGGHGAKMIAYRLHPSVAVVLDVTHATDTPGIEKGKHGEIKLGGGPSVTHGSCNHAKVVERLIQVAEAEEIPLQHEAASLYTGTDTDDVFIARTGVPSALVSLPMRYMHSTVEMVDTSDIENCVRLLEAFSRSVESAEAFNLKL